MAHLASRSAYYISLFLGIVLFSFTLFHLIPSDPARTILGPNANAAQVESLKEKLGLDKPLYAQFLTYIRNVAALDFGHSYVDERNVFREVSERLRITFSLVGFSLLFTFAYLLTVILTFSVSWLRRLHDLADFLMSSLPVFFSGIIVALLALYIYPFTSFSGRLDSWESVLFLAPPALVLALYPMAILSGILKEEMESSLQSLYVTAQRSWGFSERSILFRYALKNCLIPIVSTLSNILPVLLTGAFVVEIIFSVPGIGTLLVKSILERDFPMLECIVIVNGAFFVLVNLGFEYLYPVLDPRIASE